jgi:predicted  nucleic acid-binding Zn-ribbon protein
MSKLVDDQVKKTDLLISGLRNNMDVVNNLGLSENLFSEIETESSALSTANQELEQLKKELKEKSMNVNRQLFSLRKKFMEIKKKVKVSIGNERWKEVGIMDKK